MKITSKIDKVRTLLIEKPWLRDNDNMLLAYIWESELKEKKVSTQNDMFLAMYGMGKLSNAESIRRCRQKLQQENPELRGGNYKGRQMAIDDVIEELKNFDKI